MTEPTDADRQKAARLALGEDDVAMQINAIAQALAAVREEAEAPLIVATQDSLKASEEWRNKYTGAANYIGELERQVASLTQKLKAMNELEMENLELRAMLPELTKGPHAPTDATDRKPTL